MFQGSSDMKQEDTDREPRSGSMEEIIAYSAAGGPGGLDRRLRELDDKLPWDRAFGIAGNLVVLAALLLGATRSRAWLLVSAGAAGLLLQQAFNESPRPGPLLRRLGLRTRQESDEERMALKALRGDFKELPAFTHGQDVEAVRRLLDVIRR